MALSVARLLALAILGTAAWGTLFAAEVRVRVTTPDGQPAEGVSINLSPGAVSSLTDVAGDAVLNVPGHAAVCTLTPGKQDHVFIPCQVTVEAGRDAQSVSFVATSLVAVSSREAAVQRAATPVFNKQKGRYYANVTVTMTCATSGAIIRYTTDGSEPTSGSTLYKTPVTLSATTTLKAKALKNGLPDSGTMRKKYTIINKVAKPVFSLIDGTYYAQAQVKISCATAGAVIRYTLDGSTPTSASAIYSATLNLTSDTKAAAKSFLDGVSDSPVSRARYKVLARVATPTVSPATGTIGYDSIKAVLSCATTGATIRYTTDGSEPSESSPSYSTALILSKSTAVRAKAFKDSLAASNTVAAQYVVLGQVAPPTFSNPSGPLYGPAAVKLSCATAGATIRCTMDGSLPTALSAAYPSAGINVTDKMIIKAQGFKDGLKESEVIEAHYSVVMEAAQPVISPAAKRVDGGLVRATITCATAGATIRYTLDGSEPTASSMVFSTALNITQTTTLKAKAFKDGLEDSKETVVTYTFLQ